MNLIYYLKFISLPPLYNIKKGCGIYGNEGMRAVQASDFAFGEF
jgi:hypothetical protein